MKRVYLLRIRAKQNCFRAGFHTACDLCKRCIVREHRFGSVNVKSALAWRSKGVTRQICHSCYLILNATIEDLERNGARMHMTAEDYSELTEEELYQKVQDESIRELKKAKYKERNALFQARNKQEED